MADISRAILAADTVDTHWSERFAPLLVLGCIATALIFVGVATAAEEPAPTPKVAVSFTP